MKRRVIVWMVMVGVCGMVEQRALAASEAAGQTLMEARVGFSTANVENSFRSDGPPARPPRGSGFRLVHYPSPAGKLAAYLSADPGDGVARPALVWAHGGFGGIGPSQWESERVRAFLDAGFVVMSPSWRGECDNRGRFELFYGEVDDALAAIDYVAALPYVDASRVYIAGHSTGGTIAMLAALASDRLRAAFSFGGAPDVGRVVEDGEGYGNTPFPYRDERERRLRTAVNFVDTLRVPTWYFEGADSLYSGEAEHMEALAQAAGTPYRAFTIAGGDHFNIVAPIARMLARKLAEDTGPQLSLSLDESDLRSAFDVYAADMVGELLEASPYTWTTQLELAIDAGAVSRALVLGAVGATRFPELARVQLLYSHALLQSWQLDAAYSYAERARELAGNDPEVISQLASLAWLRGEVGDAQRLLREALVDHPDHPALLDELDTYETYAKALAGESPSFEPGSAQAAAAAFLTEVAAGRAKQAVLERFDEKALRSLFRSALAGIAPDVSLQDDEPLDLAVTGFLMEGGKFFGDHEYRAWVLWPNASDEGDTVVVSGVVLLWGTEDADELRQQLEIASVPGLGNDALGSLAAGMSELERDAWMQRLTTVPSMDTGDIAMRLREDQPGSWKIVDFQYNELWASQLGEQYAAGVEAGVLPDASEASAKDSARAFAEIVGELLVWILFAALVYGAICGARRFRRWRFERRVRQLTRRDD